MNGKPVCELPPGYLAAVYETMHEYLSDGRLPGVEERLEQSPWDLDYLSDLAQLYRRAHEAVLEENPNTYADPTGDTGPWFRTLGYEHAAVASWLLIGGSEGHELSYEFHTEVRSQLDASLSTSPTSGAIVSWVLTRPVVPWSSTPPAAFPLSSGKEELDAAYRGLLTHLVQLNNTHDELSGIEEGDDLRITTIIWRIGAIIDSLTKELPADHSMRQRIRTFLPAVAAGLTLGEQRIIQHALVDTDFVTDRHILTHLNSQNGSSFVDVASRHYELDSIIERCSAITLSYAWFAADTNRDNPPPIGQFQVVDADLDGIKLSL